MNNKEKQLVLKNQVNVAKNNSFPVIGKSEARLSQQKQVNRSQKLRFFSIPERKTISLFFILLIFLLTTFTISAISSDIDITNIQFEKAPNYTHLTVKASGLISGYDSSYLENPERIVIELNNAMVNINMIYNIEKMNRSIALLNKSSIKKVECNQIEDKATNIVKIIISLYEKVDYKINLSDDKSLLYIDINDRSKSEELENQVYISSLDETIIEDKQNYESSKASLTDTGENRLTEVSSDVTFTNIWYEKVPNYTHLTVKASGTISGYEVFYLKNPERIVIDINNTTFNIPELTKSILLLNMGAVKKVRFGQFEKVPIPITRIVIDLLQKANYEIKTSSDNRLLYIDVYDYFEFKEPEEETLTVTPALVKGEVEEVKKEEKPKISLLDIYTEPINLKIYEEDITNLIRGLSELTGIDIMLDDSVTGTITLNFSDKTFREAIELILLNKGLDYAEVSDTLIIASKDIIQGYVKPVTKIFELKHASVENAKGILDSYKTEGSKIKIVVDSRMNTIIVEGTEEEIEKINNLIDEIDIELLTRTFKIDNAIDDEEIDAIKNMLTILVPEEDRINIDRRQNEIVIKGTKEELDNVETMIVGLDKRASQIMLEAKIVEITLEAKKDLGVNWTTSTSDEDKFQISFGELTLGGSFERLGLISAKLEALQNEGKTNILSNPKVLTLNGKEASIETGKQIPLIKTDAEGATTVEYKKVGLTLTLTPYLSSDKSLTIDTFVTINSLGAEVYQGYPVINSREEKVIIRTNLDETVVIGGLITSEEIKNTTEIPILGKIPIFGELFKFTNSKNEKTEIIILITAHLLDY